MAEARRKLRATLSTKDFASLSTGDFTVRCSARDRDVHAVYRRDEAVLQLRIRLPPAFPLQRVRIACEQRMGVTEAQWATWELQMYALLSAKDASIVHALQFFKDNLDKLFEKVEPCPICFAIIHMTDRSLPSFACGRCRNKFHNTCLNQWMRSSATSGNMNAGSCPMCRAQLRG